MDLSKILSISGKPGLYKLVGEAKANLVVESLTDGKRGPAFSHERISTLEEISIYTESEDIALKEVFRKIHDKFGDNPAPNPKKASANEIKKLFEEVLPDYDQEQVYVSDMKKVFTWYNFLLEKGMLDFTEEEDSAEETKAEEVKGKEKTAEEKEADKA
jgi:hypothetical protein